MKPSPDQMQRDKESAIEWANGVLDDGNKVIYLDTETTGRPYVEGESCEVIQLAITNHRGIPIVNNLIQPLDAKSEEDYPEAHKVHGIGREDWEWAPTFIELAPVIHRVMEGKRVVIYNSAFDEEVMRREFARTGIQFPDCTIECLMLKYAAYKGQWNNRKDGYRWQKLPMSVLGQDAHDAAVDCRSSKDLVIKMAGITLTDSIDLNF